MNTLKLLGYIFLLLLVVSCQEANVQVDTVKASIAAVNPNAEKASYKAAPKALQTWVNARAGTGADAAPAGRCARQSAP